MTGLLAHTGTRLPGSLAHAADRCAWIPAPPPPAPEPGASQKSARAPWGHSHDSDSGAGQAGRGSQLGPFLTRRWGNAPSLKMCGR